MKAQSDNKTTIKKFLLGIVSFAMSFLIISCVGKNNIPDYKNPNVPIEKRVANLLDSLTIEEKANFLSGKDLWHIEGVERLGIPSIQVTDCGHGVTVILDKGGNYSGCATCFPTGVGQAATWNKELEYEMGTALARETRALGSTILLAPMVNIHWTPIGGRNYETYSEDPFLSGKMATALINGIQSEHIGACIKAVTANNQQYAQSSTSVEVSERALHEIYLKSFEIAIDESNPWSLMTSYNMVNGEYVSANKHFMKDIIKGDWNYEGVIVSDWRGTHSETCIPAGLDLEMPGPGKFLRQQDILNALEKEIITEEELNDRVARILRVLVKSKLLDYQIPELNSGYNTPEHQDIARRVAEECIVLLKNSSKTLPLDKTKIKKLAVIGPNAKEARLGGGGSASVTPCYSVSPLNGLENYCGESVEVLFEEGCGMKGGFPTVYTDYLSTKDGDKEVKGLKGEYFRGKKLEGNPVHVRVDEKIDYSWGWAAPCEEVHKNEYSVRWTGQLHPPVSGKYNLGLSCNEGGCRLYINNKLLIDEWGDPDNEMFEAALIKTSKSIEIDLEKDKLYDIKVEFHKKANRNTIRLEWEMPGNEDPILKAAKLAENCDAAVVFVGLSNLFEGGMNDREDILLPEAQNKLINAVTKANPNTIVVLINGTPIGMPWIDDVNAILEAYYPGQEGGNAIAKVLFGDVNPSGKLPETFPKKLEDNPSYGLYPGENGKVHYKNGIFVGYRYYDAKNIEPLFPFGYGLSYTTFEYSNLQISEDKEGNYTATVDVKNTGDYDGAEVVQLYIKDVECSVERPEKELKSFEKAFINKGEKKTVTLSFKKNDLAFYSENLKQWVVEPGKFEILIGSSSRDIRLSDAIMAN